MNNRINDQFATERTIISVEDSLVACLWKYRLIIGLSFIIALSVELGMFLSGTNSYFFPIAIWAFLLAGFCFVVQENVKRDLMRQFAKENKFSYSKSGDIEDLDGSDRVVSNVIDGVCENYEVKIFNYGYEAKGANGSRATFYATVFMFRLDKKMPNMVLKENGPTFEGIFYKSDSRIKLELEGNFNEYFELEIEKGYETEALQIFTPDIMEDLIEKAKSFNVEIVDDHFFIYDRRIIEKKRELYDFFEAAKYFMNKLGPKIERMRSL